MTVFQSGRSYNWGTSNFGWSVSSDAGVTWTDGFLPDTTVHADPPGPWQRVTDPAIAYDAKHDVWLIIGVGTRPCSFSLKCTGSQVFVSRSTDGARTFDAPVIPKRARRTQFHDVPWVTCDNFADSEFYGNCYSVWNDDAHHQLLNAYTSSDSGVTWSKAAITPKQHCDFHPIPAALPEGKVVIPLLGCGTKTDRTLVSTDGGSTYVSRKSNLMNFDARGAGGNLRAGTMRRLDVGGDGTIYTVWTDCYFRFRREGPTLNTARHDGTCRSFRSSRITGTRRVTRNRPTLKRRLRRPRPAGRGARLRDPFPARRWAAEGPPRRTPASFGRPRRRPSRRS